MRRANCFKMFFALVVLLSAMLFSSCSTVALRWFVSHKHVTVSSTADDTQSVARVTERRRPFRTKDSFWRKVYVDQIVSAHSAFEVSSLQFSVKHGGNSISPKINAVALANNLNNYDNTLNSYALQLVFDVNTELNDSVYIVEKDIPRQGDSIVIRMSMSEPVEAFDRDDKTIFRAIDQASGYIGKWALSRPSLYDDMTFDKNECVQNFDVQFVSYDEQSNVMCFTYEGYRYQFPLEKQLENIQSLVQGNNIKIQVRFRDCLKCQHDVVSLPSATIVSLM